MIKYQSCAQCGAPLSASQNLDRFCNTQCEAEFHRRLETLAPTPRDLMFWRQYRLLQSDFLTMLSFVAPEEKNFNVYSDRLLALLRGVGAEIDSICKVVVPPAENNRTNMSDWRVYLESKFKLSRACLFVPAFRTSVQPFAAFHVEQSPSWWNVYSKLKHRWHDHAESATLRTALDALGALFMLNVLFLEPTFEKIWQLRGQWPSFSDAGLWDEMHLLFYPYGPGFEVQSEMGESGLVSVVRLTKAI